jgi:hypothetical protein
MLPVQKQEYVQYKADKKKGSEKPVPGNKIGNEPDEFHFLSSEV